MDDILKASRWSHKKSKLAKIAIDVESGFEFEILLKIRFKKHIEDLENKGILDKKGSYRLLVMDF